VRDPNEVMSEHRRESQLKKEARRAARMLRVGEAKIHAFEDRQGGFVFVKVPGEYGRYVRTRVAVVLAPCPACGAVQGEPCKDQYDRYTGSIHADRLVKARRVLAEMVPGSDGGVGKAIAQDGEEPPYVADDQPGDEEPDVIGAGESDDAVVDLRRFFDR
jgi:hypothetical protein